jgi:hypothetical protein
MMYAGLNKDTANWQGKYDIEKERMTGFLAQDVEEAARQSGYDFSGLVKPKNENDLYSLRYSDFVVPLVKAAQELSQKVKEQDAKIEALLKEVENLKSRVH